MRSLILGTSVLSLCLGLGASAQDAKFDLSQQIGPNPILPDPSPSLIPDLKVAEVVGWKDGETPAVPDALKVTAYAKDLANPRTVHTLSNGDVLVVQSRGPAGEPTSRPKDFIRDWIMSIAHGGGEQKESNIITLLRDTNRDGTVDERHDLLKKLDSPFGLAWIDNTLYVATTSAILAYPYELGQNEITAQPKTLTPLPGGPINHHWTKDLALSPDGQMLYVSVGSNSNIVENGLEAEKGRAAIWQVDRQTGAARVFASGLRNPNGLAFHPETGELWTVVNERDELGPNLVPDYMTSVKDGAFYGWPWSYYGNHVDARVHPPRPDMVDKALQPDYALSSHVAALGLTFSMNSALPAAYANGAFIGEHGSWNRDSFNGYRVIFVPFQNGKPSGKAQDVVTGFLQGDQAKGRPVGVGIDGTGALLVADDAGNTVWRIASSDGRVTPQPTGTDQVPANQQLSSSAKTGRVSDGVSGIGTEITASTTPSAPPPLSADERLTGQEPLSGQPDKLVPTQMQIAPATGP
ncbi:sorbosone dehydrogenase family protein [Neorhizobium galegae]|uniref:PQQ-dependent sugar dehydrogenase n=1 Tax=Neorhizobium galegae TaxID=399 RepID=UPI002102EBCC|nr:sorbosone dehydrogenase family protein [Neorhizobium galegae]MCQ1775798.1 sorbosone dehydrogenase family protein [Neorhizobium galegae]MCQ1800046.1 sorbosone dehydrogenase family protein [Neorhizobium galegae]